MRCDMVRACSKKGGFTLIELLVVIAIIGILSTVIFASLSTARDKGRVASAIATQDELRKATALYYSDMGFYPPDVTRGVDPGFASPLPFNPDTGLDCATKPADCPPCTSNLCPADWTATVLARWHGPYINHWPPATPWGGEYDYNFWPVTTPRGPGGTCALVPGVYIGVEGDYTNGNTIPPTAEQEMLNKNIDLDGCLDGESQMVLESL